MFGSSPVRSLQIFSWMEVAKENVNSRAMKDSDMNYKGDIASDAFRPVAMVERVGNKSSLTTMFKHDIPGSASARNEMKRKQEFQLDDLRTEINILDTEVAELKKIDIIETGLKISLRRNKSSALLLEENRGEVNVVPIQIREFENINVIETGLKTSLRRNKSSALLFEENREEVNIVPLEGKVDSCQDRMGANSRDLIERSCIEKSKISSNSISNTARNTILAPEQHLVSAMRYPLLALSSTEVCLLISNICMSLFVRLTKFM